MFGTETDLGAKFGTETDLGAQFGTKTGYSAKNNARFSTKIEPSAKSQKTAEKPTRGKAFQTELKPAQNKVYCKHCGKIVFSRKLKQHYTTKGHTGKTPDFL